MAKSKQKYYVVWEGRSIGLFDNWPECQAAVKGYEGARYKSFKSKELAEEALYGNSKDYIGQNPKDTALSPEQLLLIGKPEYPSLAVDAACSGNPGVLEYQGVDARTGKLLFHHGPFPKGTVNIGEFLALVHGLALLDKKGSKMPVYSDSRTAIAWVRNKKVKTNLERNYRTEKLFDLVDRAIYWLETHSGYPNEVRKWETEAWGEIPADFGRK